MAMMKIIIITACIIAFVITEVKKPINDPTPALIACFNSTFVTRISPITAPTNGPIKIPAIGIINGPTSNPIVLPTYPLWSHQTF